MYSDDKKFIFLHIPKTGGTSIERHLKNFGLKGTGHIKISEMKKKYNLSENKINEYFKFAVIRNPWDLAVSRYEYSKMKKSFWHSDDGSTPYGLHQDYNLVKNKSFSEFLNLMYEKKLNSIHNKFDQIHFIDFKIDLFLKFENLNEDFKKLCNILNIKKNNLSKINKSNRKYNDYKKYYTNKKDILIVKKFFARDIKKFNYRF